MTDQPTLFDPPAPRRKKRHRTATTSREGLDRVRPVRTKQQQLVLDILRAHGRLTRHQVAAIALLPLSSVCGRVNELLKAGELQIAVEGGQRLRKDGRYLLSAVIQHTLARTA